MPRKNWPNKVVSFLGALALAACAQVPPTGEAVGRQHGLTVESRQSPDQSGTVLEVKGASWLMGGDARDEFRKQAGLVAQKHGCERYRVDGLSESQENTVLGTRRVLRGRVVCEK